MDIGGPFAGGPDSNKLDYRILEDHRCEYGWNEETESKKLDNWIRGSKKFDSSRLRKDGPNGTMFRKEKNEEVIPRRTGLRVAGRWWTGLRGRTIWLMQEPGIRKTGQNTEMINWQIDSQYWLEQEKKNQAKIDQAKERSRGTWLLARVRGTGLFFVSLFLCLFIFLGLWQNSHSRMYLAFQFNLVCGNQWKQPLTSFVYFLGGLSGCLVSGQISDWYPSVSVHTVQLSLTP